jgi:gas vesicle protein
MAEDNGKFVWFVAGAAIGASLALLYAPQTGNETRRYIKRKARKHGEALVDSGRDLADRGRELFEKGRGLADDAAEMFERGRKLVDG